MIAHSSPISGIDARGRFVATTGYDNQVILWDDSQKAGIARGFHDHLANQCQFSACGRFLVSSGSDYTARVWSIPDMRLRVVLADHNDDVEMAVINPDASAVATASRDHLIRIYSLNGALKQVLAGHRADVLSVAWVNRGRELLSSSDDGTVRRWSAEDGRLLETIDFGGVETDTIAVADNGYIYAGNDEGNIVALGPEVRRAYEAHDAGVKRLVYDSTSRLLLSTGYDAAVKLWSADTCGGLSLIRCASVPSSVWLRSCAFQGNSTALFGTFGKTYASLCLSKGAWNLKHVDTTPGINAVCVNEGHTWSVGDAGVVFKDGTPRTSPGSCCNFIGGWPGTVVTGGQAGTLFNANTGAVLHRHRSPLNCSAVALCGEKRFLIIGAYTGEGLIFRQAGEGLDFLGEIRLFDNAVKGLACNGAELFSVCANGDAAIHALPGFTLGRFIARAHDRIANGVAVLRDGRFTSVSRDRKLRIWSAAEPVLVDTPHDHSIKCVASQSNGPLIATGSYDGRVALYDTDMRAWTFNRRVTTSGISSIAHRVSAGVFIASSYDGRIHAIPTK